MDVFWTHTHIYLFVRYYYNLLANDEYLHVQIVCAYVINVTNANIE